MLLNKLKITKFGYENNILFINCWKISCEWGTICLIFEQIFPVKKQIVYQTKRFGIQSIFIFIQFEIDQIVSDRPNRAVT